MKLTGILVGKRTQSGLVHFRQAAAKSVRVDEIHLGKRGRMGQELIPVKTGDGVVDVTPVQDGLAFWKKSAVTARKRDAAADGSDGDDGAVLEIVEENQLQVALPGLETARQRRSETGPIRSKPVPEWLDRQLRPIKSPPHAKQAAQHRIERKNLPQARRCFSRSLTREAG